jgi:hypothetical protein
MIIVLDAQYPISRRSLSLKFAIWIPFPPFGDGSLGEKLLKLKLYRDNTPFLLLGPVFWQRGKSPLF